MVSFNSSFSKGRLYYHICKKGVDSFSYWMTVEGFLILPHCSDIEPFLILVLLTYTCVSITDPVLLCIFLQISQQIHRMRQSSKEHQVSVKTVHKYSGECRKL